MLKSDSGNNFIGTEKAMEQNKIRRFLQNLGSDWIIWKKNLPAGSHFGGFWECQIRSARAVWNQYSELKDQA